MNTPLIVNRNYRHRNGRVFRLLVIDAELSEVVLVTTYPLSQQEMLSWFGPIDSFIESFILL